MKILLIATLLIIGCGRSNDKPSIPMDKVPVVNTTEYTKVPLNTNPTVVNSVIIEQYQYEVSAVLGGKQVQSTVHIRRQSTVFTAIIMWKVDGETAVHQRAYSASLDPHAFILKPEVLDNGGMALEFEYELGQDGIERLIPTVINVGGDSGQFTKSL